MIIKTIYIDSKKDVIKIGDINENPDDVENSLSEIIEIFIKKLVN